MMRGICSTCGCVCVLDKMWEQFGCPACRAARVAEAFRPVDPLRTALSTPASFTVTKTGEIKSLEAQAYWRGERLAEPEEEQTEVPEGCKMPLGNAAQCYELRRLFRL
jgi:hypothetical protein